MSRRILIVVFGLLLLASPASAQSEEPSIFICGIWPDKILYFDQSTDTFSDGLTLRHGAVTGSNFTTDRRKFFLITDRMESVEVVDPIRREIIDEFKLSTPERRVRIFGVFPDPEGKKAFLSVSAVELGVDRYIREEGTDLIVYDLEKREVVKTVELPEEVMRGRWRPQVHIPPDGSTIFVFGRDVYQLDGEDFTIKDRLNLSKPLYAGYGAFRGLSLTEHQPGVFYSIYKTEDPVQKKKLFGVARIDLYKKEVDNFELGPELKVGRFALAPDGKRGYAGLNDLVVVDMEARRVIKLKEGFERGRTNSSLIVSHDGTKLYISGVGDTIWVYDAETLEQVKTVYAGGDFMLPPVEIPSELGRPSTSGKR